MKKTSTTSTSTLSQHQQNSITERFQDDYASSTPKDITFAQSFQQPHGGHISSEAFPAPQRGHHLLKSKHPNIKGYHSWCVNKNQYFVLYDIQFKRTREREREREYITALAVLYVFVRYLCVFKIDARYHITISNQSGTQTPSVPV